MTAPLPSLAEGVRLAPSAVQALAADERRIVIVGAGGWIGRALLAGLHAALGEAAGQRIACFGSQARSIDIGEGRQMAQHPLADLAALPSEPTVLFHLAFLTKDKVGTLTDADYANANRALSHKVLDALEPIGADRLFLASSGAAAFADSTDAAADLRLYGSLKRDDEDMFARWARAEPDRRALIVRIFSLTGPFINKHDTYAFASFVLAALAGCPIKVRAPMRVVRSYVALREVLSLALAELLAPEGPAVKRIDSGGEALELGEVAQRIANRLGGSVDRRSITAATANIYAADRTDYDHVLQKFGIEPVSFDQQIGETAAYLARVTAGLES
jgi:nucleoside-diphosphate-sugar epimerase